MCNCQKYELGARVTEHTITRTYFQKYELRARVTEHTITRTYFQKYELGARVTEHTITRTYILVSITSFISHLCHRSSYFSLPWPMFGHLLRTPKGSSTIYYNQNLHLGIDYIIHFSPVSQVIIFLTGLTHAWSSSCPYGIYWNLFLWVIHKYH
jgi:hypothetical protein